MKVSVLILAHNEAANLPACLGALRWCDDLVVVDSGSTDDSVAIAAKHDARVLVRTFDNFSNQRNFGLERGGLRHRWVLHLDADEIVTEDFAARLMSLSPDDAIDAYRVPFKIIFFGRWLRHGGMWPSYQVRLGRTDRLRFIQVGHGQREDLTPERVGVFPEPLLHYSFSHGLRSWLEKHVRYAADEAAFLAEQRSAGGGDLLMALTARDATIRRRAFKRIWGRLPLFTRPFARFFYGYVLRRGFLDGRAGLLHAVLMTVYEAMIGVLFVEASAPAGSNRMPDGDTHILPITCLAADKAESSYGS